MRNPLCSWLCAAVLVAITADQAFADWQGVVNSAITSWNGIYGSQVQALGWTDNGLIASESARQATVQQITDPANAWMPSGDVGSPSTMTALRVIDDPSIAASDILAWTTTVNNLVAIGHRRLTISWFKTGFGAFTTTCVVDANGVVYDDMLSNIAGTPTGSTRPQARLQTTRCFDLHLGWIWQQTWEACTRGSITADNKILCSVDGKVIACDKDCIAGMNMGTASINCRSTQLAGTECCQLEYSWAWACGFKTIKVATDHFSLEVEGIIGSSGSGNGSDTECCSADTTGCQWPPPGPGEGQGCVPEKSGCPLPSGYACDTLVIDQCRNPAAQPHAAAGDIVRGVGGIVTALDVIPTGFGFYMQRSAPAGAPWTGVYVFTGGVNRAASMGLSIGDSVVVEYGRMAESGGGTEILSPNNSASAPDIVLRRVSSGNPLPAFRVSTAHELNWSPTNTSAEQWEGSLVRLQGTLHVARHVGLGTCAIPGANCILVDDMAPSDSIYVDTGTLAGMVAPALGSIVSAVQGPFDQRNVAGQSRYGILVRHVSDLTSNDPPHLIDAYNIAPDMVRVVFDRPVTSASATNTLNYSYASLSSVDHASLEGDMQSVDLAITPAVPPGVTDRLTVDGIVSLTSGLPMVSPESRDHVQGILTIQALRGPNEDSLAAIPCKDVADFLGDDNGSCGNTSLNPVRVSLSGVATGASENLFYLEMPSGGQRSGVAVFAPTVALVRGHSYLIAGGIEESPVSAIGLSETQITGTAYILDEGVASTPPPVAVALPTLIAKGGQCASAALHPNGKDFAGVLVRVDSVLVIDDEGPGHAFRVKCLHGCPGDTLTIDNTAGVWAYTPSAGDLLRLVGILRLRNGVYRLEPRDDSDITVLEPLSSATLGVPQQVSLAVAPNPARVARITFTVPRSSMVDLAVLDVTGRRVAQLKKGVLAAGQHVCSWDGATEKGSVASAGLYFFRLRVGTEVRSVQAVHLR